MTLHLVTTCDLVTIFQKTIFHKIQPFHLVTLCNLVTVFAETKSVTKSRLHCTKLNSNLIYLTKSWKKTVQNHSSNWFTVRFLDKCSKIEVFLALKSRIHHRNRHYNLSGLRLLVKPEMLYNYALWYQFKFETNSGKSFEPNPVNHEERIWLLL